MIYTVTFNPSLDYIVTMDQFQLGRTNRTLTEQMLPGGKGINVSTVLNNLGIETTALGFTAGFTGEEICRKVRALGIPYDFIPVEEGFSRINVKLKDYDGTEINGKGPQIPPDKIQQLFEKLDTLKEGDTLVLAGSIPESLPDSIYKDIFIMGLAFITEGAIPFAASDPLHVLPSCVIGAAVSGALSMAFGCTLMAPHGGIFVFPVVEHALLYLAALVIGTIVGAVLLGLLKKKAAQ